MPLSITMAGGEQWNNMAFVVCGEQWITAVPGFTYYYGLK